MTAAAQAPLALMIHFASREHGAQVLEQALALCQALGVSETSFRLDSRRKLLSSSYLLERLARTKPLSFWIDGEQVAFQQGPCAGPGVFLNVRLPSTPPLSLLDVWLPKLASVPQLTYARLYDTHWERWQNEIFPDQVELCGESSIGLKRVREPDLDMMVIDTSVNPGRIARRTKLTEALGHQMWLFRDFWLASGAQRALVEAELATRELEHGVLGVTLCERAFDGDNPAPERPREVLFPYSPPEKPSGSYTWFLADEAERGTALAGWQMPALPTGRPERHLGTSPFSKERLVSWRYSSAETPAASPDAVPPRYEGLPQFESKLDLFEVAKLVHVLGNRDADQVWSLLNHLVLGGPAGLVGSVHFVPPDLVEVLAVSSGRRERAQRWAALGSSAPSAALCWTYETWLTQLCDLALIARSTKRDMFVHHNR